MNNCQYLYLVHQHKRGNTFDMSGLALMEDDDSNADMTGWSGSCQVRDEDGSLIEQLTFQWLDASTSAFRIHSAPDTSSWPLGRAYFDIQFTTDTGNISSSSTVTVLIAEDITR